MLDDLLFNRHILVKYAYTCCQIGYRLGSISSSESNWLSRFLLTSVAYVGGGFGKNSLHNILEPMAFNIPTLFGPNYHRFNEAIDAIKQEVAFSISSR